MTTFPPPMPHLVEPSIQQLLRLVDEEWVYINELQAHSILVDHSLAFMDQIFSFYDEFPHTEIQLPIKQVFESPALTGDFRVMPCVIDTLQIKCVKIIGTNEEQRTIKDKICVGKALLIDYYDNHVYALFDVCALSSFRTAAIACLALRRSGIEPISVGVIGAGRIGFYTALILHRWYGINTITFCDSDPSNRDRFAALCRQTLPKLIIREQPLEIICRESEAVFLATTAQNPLCTSANSANIKFISSVGADADNLSEIDVSLTSSHRLLTDSMQSMCLGDMKRWYADGMLDISRVTELKDFKAQAMVVAEKILFISTGVAVQDALVCKFIYDVYQRLYCKVFKELNSPLSPT